MLIRPLDTLPGDFTAIKRQMDANYSVNQSIWQTTWTEQTLDVRLEAGDVSMMGELNTSLPNNGPQYFFNRTRPLLSMVSGYQRRNRKSTIVVPLENADQETADQWTKIIMNIYKREGVLESLSEAFYQGACITGLSFLHVYLDWKDDPICGNIKVDVVPYSAIFPDPYFTKPDLSDAKFIWRRSYLTHTEAAILMPEKYYDEVMALPGNPTGTGRDGKFQYMVESYGRASQNLVAYDEYYYRDYRKRTLLVDKQTGESLDISKRSDVDLEGFLGDNPRVEKVEQIVPTVRLAIQIQDKVFYDGPNPLNIDTLPFIPVFGYFNPMMPYYYSRIQGICRSLRDPQILLNRRIILNFDIAESIGTSGFIFKEDAVVDIKHLFQTGAGRMIPIKKGANIADVQQIAPPQVPPSFFQLSETASKEMNLVTGINEELMGSAIDDKAGILAALRQGAGLTTLQPLFDRLDYSQNLLGNLIMEIVRNNYTPQKIKLFLEGKQPTPFFYNKAFGKYHCAVELGFDTETQKQLQFAQMYQLKELGELPRGALLNAATIQNKTEIYKQLQQEQQQAAQAQQAQMQAQMQEQQARTKLAQARAIADQGLGVERMSRIAENQALAQERRAEAAKDDYQAVLNYVKALKEIEGIDLAQIEKIMALKRIIETEESQVPQSPLEQYNNEQPGL